MKKLFAMIIVILANLGIFAQSPLKMTYQAVIRNQSNNLIANHLVGMRISILHGSASGSPIYIETQYTNTNINGLVSIEIGGGIIISGSIADIDWSNGPYFLKTETDPSGGENYTITLTSQLLSVPYALHANTADNGFSGDYNDLINTPDFANWDSNNSDDFNGDYNSLTNKPDLFSGEYNDLIDKPSIPLINDTNFSTSTLWSSIKTNSEISKKADLKDLYTKFNLQTEGQSNVHYHNISNKPVNLDENNSDDVTVTNDQLINGVKTFNNTILTNGGINTNNKNIFNLANPVNSQDAATKSYVDNLEARLAALEHIVGRTGTLSDIEGNIYGTILIGNQWWMAENLRVTKSNDGNDIGDWSVRFVVDSSTIEEYGLIYLTTSDRICPTSWHIPRLLDWKKLEASLGFIDVSDPTQPPEHYFIASGGAQLKSNGSSGFNALFAGEIYIQGGMEYEERYSGFGTTAGFWGISDELGTFYSIKLTVENNMYTRHKLSTEREWYGFSIRCVQD